jgi:dTDP-4-amino-4,6-dideoxygalactose transaminase
MTAADNLLVQVLPLENGDRNDCYRYQEMCDRLVDSEQAQEHTILLPLFHQITEEKQNHVLEILKTVC